MALLISRRPFGASFSVSSHPFNLANDALTKVSQIRAGITGGIGHKWPKDSRKRRPGLGLLLTELIWALISGFRRTTSFPCQGSLAGHGVFGLFPLHDQIEQRVCLSLGTETTDLVSATAELSKETFQQVVGTSQLLVGERDPQVVEGQIKILQEAPHSFGFKRGPFLLKVGQYSRTGEKCLFPNH